MQRSCAHFLNLRGHSWTGPSQSSLSGLSPPLRSHPANSGWFLALFNGIKNSVVLRGDGAAFLNPEGIGSFSPRLGRFIEALPWVATMKDINPARVESPCLIGSREPLQGSDFLFRFTQGSSFLATAGLKDSNPFGIGQRNQGGTAEVNPTQSEPIRPNPSQSHQIKVNPTRCASTFYREDKKPNARNGSFASSCLTIPSPSLLNAKPPR